MATRNASDPLAFLPLEPSPVRGQGAPAKGQPRLGPPESPRLAALAREVKAVGQDAVKRFWEGVKGKAPLVEPVAGDDRSRQVTFLWRGGDDARGIKLIGPVPPDLRQKHLEHLEGTDVWFLTARFPTAARFSYAFALSGKHHPDPLNTLTEGRDSLAEMAGAPPQPWVRAREVVPKGALKPHKLRSELLKEERSVSVYTPAGYAHKGAPCGLLIVFDGQAYRNLVPTPTILDNLVASRKVPPMVAILIDNADQAARTRDLTCSAPFADFLAKELVPWARRKYRLSPDPKQTVVCGSSLGGLCAAYCALRHPGVFGNVLSQSGSFWYYPGWPKGEAGTVELGWLTRQFEGARLTPARFYLEAGLFEVDRPLNILAENRRLRKALEAKGYSVVYSEFAGGHEYICWRGSLADGLIALVGGEKQK